MFAAVVTGQSHCEYAAVGVAFEVAAATPVSASPDINSVTVSYPSLAPSSPPKRMCAPLRSVGSPRFRLDYVVIQTRPRASAIASSMA